MQDIEAIIADLYKLDPELALHDNDIRTLVAGLLENQPKPVPDQVFVEKLRRALLVTAPKPALTWQTVLWHMLPVGAVAAVVFVLAPSYTSTVPYQVVTPPTVETATPMAEEEIAPASAKMVGSEGMSQPTTEGDVSAAAQSFSLEPVPGEIMAEEDISMMRTMMVTESEVPTGESMDTSAKMTSMPTDPAGTSLQHGPIKLLSEHSSSLLQVRVEHMAGSAGYIVVRLVEAEGLGRVVGNSPYLRNEFKIDQLVLSQREDLQIGATYSVGLYHDNQASPEDIAWFNYNTDPLVYEFRFTVKHNGMFTVLP